VSSLEDSQAQLVLQHVIERKASRALVRRFSAAGGRLRLDNLSDLARWEAVQLLGDAEVFIAGETRRSWEQHLEHVFWRFDLSGRGWLSEDEGILFLEAMRKYCRNAQGRQQIHLPFKRVESAYQLRKKLGEGGFANVYLARDLTSAADWVVKILAKDSANCKLKDLKTEFDMLRSIGHQGIQRIHDMFCDYDNVYIVSEAYTGGNLTQLYINAFRAGVTVTNVYLAKVLFQVTDALCYMHSKCIMHCDIKESNLMIANNDKWESPHVVVIDFGLAQSFVANGHPGGTPGYAPPEVWTDRLWTPKGDVHSLGVVIFQLFSGKACYHGQPSTSALRASTCYAEPAFAVVDEFEELQHLLTLMLDKNFHNRPSAKQCMEHTFYTLHMASENGQQVVKPRIVPAALEAIQEKQYRCEVHLTTSKPRNVHGPDAEARAPSEEARHAHGHVRVSGPMEVRVASRSPARRLSRAHSAQPRQKEYFEEQKKKMHLQLDQREASLDRALRSTADSNSSKHIANAPTPHKEADVYSQKLTNGRRAAAECMIQGCVSPQLPSRRLSKTGPDERFDGHLGMRSGGVRHTLQGLVTDERVTISRMHAAPSNSPERRLTSHAPQAVSRWRTAAAQLPNSANQTRRTVPSSVQPNVVSSGPEAQRGPSQGDKVFRGSEHGRSSSLSPQVSTSRPPLAAATPSGAPPPNVPAGITPPSGMCTGGGVSSESNGISVTRGGSVALPPRGAQRGGSACMPNPQAQISTPTTSGPLPQTSYGLPLSRSMPGGRGG